MTAVYKYIADDDIRNKLGIIDSVDEEVISKTIHQKSSKEIHVKDFGAKGDGIKNDSAAIRKAITVLRRSPYGTSLVFEQGKTYYISSGEYALDLKNLKNVNVKGNGCTILVKPIMSICRIENCINMEINGITFDYKTKPYAVAEVTNVFEDGMIRIKTDRSLNIRGTYKQPVPDYFGLVDRPDSRYHIGITAYKVVNRNQFLYDVKCNNIFADCKKRIDMLKNDKYRFIVPMPHVGQVIEHAFTIQNNKNILMSDCNIRCAAKHMFYLKGNLGFVYFKNIIVEPDSADEDIPVVGWRDGFYCKDNRAKFVWDNCKVNRLCDDILHIFSTTFQVQQKQKDIVSLYCQGDGILTNEANVGDEISFFNVDTGEFLGSSIIKAINTFENYIDLKLWDDIESITATPACRAVINSLAAPGATIKNCDFHGTFRLHSSIYAVNSRLLITRMWLDIKTSRENLDENNVLFSNCDISFDDDKDKYIHIDTNNINWENAKKPYCMGDVVFYNCNIKKEAVQLGKIETENSVVNFIKCRN